MSLVGKEFPEETLGKFPILLRFPVIDIPWRELPLDNLTLVVDDLKKTAKKSMLAYK